MDTRNFTGVFIPAHIWLHPELIPAEKMMLGEISALQMKTGWCTAGRKHFAEWLQVEPQTISYYTKKLERMGFLEVDRTGYSSNKMRVNPERFMVENTPSTGLTTPVNRTDYPPSVGLTTPVSGTDPKDNNKGNNKINNKECGAPAQKTDLKDFVFPNLEEKKGTPPVPAAPSFSHRDKPTEIETHTDLLKQIDAYYKANPEEWRTSVKAMSGPSYTDAQLNEMLQDYASHSFSRRNPRQTFAQHNADFCRWVKDQKNHTKPAQSQYTRRDNKMRTVEVENHGYTADQLF